ncbi:MAG TPA: hypothetical protein VF198_17520 [Vicinamibacterales bacterium]
MPADGSSSRRTVGLVMAVSAALLGLVAMLIVAGTIPVEEDSRTLVAGVLGAAAAFDVLLGLYFFVSDAS